LKTEGTRTLTPQGYVKLYKLECSQVALLQLHASSVRINTGNYLLQPKRRTSTTASEKAEKPVEARAYVGEPAL
jgi:hypothetical protein